MSRLECELTPLYRAELLDGMRRMPARSRVGDCPHLTIDRCDHHCLIRAAMSF
jgi:hypothetical protein